MSVRERGRLEDGKTRKNSDAGAQCASNFRMSAVQSVQMHEANVDLGA